jgi:hypothetical protein
MYGNLKHAGTTWPKSAGGFGDVALKNMATSIQGFKKNTHTKDMEMVDVLVVF